MEPQINADERRLEEKQEYLHEELNKRIIGVFANTRKRQCPAVL
jgi:hypothetical protein